MTNVFVLTRTNSSGDVSVELDLDKRNILDKYNDLVRNYVAEHLDDTLEYEDMMYMPLNEIEELMEEIVEGRGTDLTSYGWEEQEFNFLPLFYGDSNMSQRVRDHVEKILVERAKVHSLVSESDFLAGAITAMTAAATPDGKEINNLWPGNPPYWVFFSLGGRSVAAQILKNKGEEAAAKHVEKRDLRISRLAHNADDMVDFIKLVRKSAGPGFLHDEATKILEDMWELGDEADDYE